MGVLNPVAVLDRAQVQHPVQVRARHRQAARGGAGGQQQRGVPEAAAVRERHLVRGRVERGDRRPQAQFDVVLGVPLGRVDVDLLPCVLAHQVAL